MHVVVILSGIADPKRPLGRPGSGDWHDWVGAPATPFKLSPFDESALEVALKLRDKDAAVKITALITDGASDIALMRTVAAYRLDQVAGLCPPAQQRGNPCWYREHVANAIRGSDATVDLWLMGREHGDLDDGVMAPYLAESWGLAFIGLALSVQCDDAGHWMTQRIVGDKLEAIRLPGPILASISNDRGNRLRHPLMKNVMQAKQQKFLMHSFVANPVLVDLATAVIMTVQPIDASRRNDMPCQQLGGTVEEQALALAHYLRQSRPARSLHVDP